jgi:hypothetical protein
MLEFTIPRKTLDPFFQIFSFDLDSKKVVESNVGIIHFFFLRALKEPDVNNLRCKPEVKRIITFSSEGAELPMKKSPML